MDVHILSEIIIQIVLIIGIALCANRKEWRILICLSIILGFHLLQTSFCFRFKGKLNHMIKAFYEIFIAIQAYKTKNMLVFSIMALGSFNQICQVIGLDMPSGTLTCLNSKM